MRTLIAACCAALLVAGCSSTPPPTGKPPAPEATTTPAADPGLCREVAKSGKDLAKIVYDQGAEAIGTIWILAAEDMVALDDSLAVDASPDLRDEVWALVDAAEAVIDEQAQESSTLESLPIDEMAQALVTVSERCAEAGHPLQ